MRNAIARVFATIVGGFVMKFVALYFHLNPFGVALAGVAGAVVGWMLVDIPGLARGIARAWHEVTTWSAKDKERWKASLLTSLVVVGFWVMWCMPFIPYIDIHAEKPGLIGGIGIMVVVIVSAMSLFLGIPLILDCFRSRQGWRNTSYVDAEEFLKDFVKYLNPVVFTFWVLYGLLYVGPKRIPALVRFIIKLSRTAFVYSHTDVRKVIALDAAICGTTWLASGNDPFIGIAVGAVVALVHYPLMRKRAERVEFNLQEEQKLAFASMTREQHWDNR